MFWTLTKTLTTSQFGNAQLPPPMYESKKILFSAYWKDGSILFLSLEMVKKSFEHGHFCKNGFDYKFCTSA